jgi:hypothetical protein
MPALEELDEGLTAKQLMLRELIRRGKIGANDV